MDAKEETLKARRPRRDTDSSMISGQSGHQNVRTQDKANRELELPEGVILVGPVEFDPENGQMKWCSDGQARYRKDVYRRRFCNICI